MVWELIRSAKTLTREHEMLQGPSETGVTPRSSPKPTLKDCRKQPQAGTPEGRLEGQGPAFPLGGAPLARSQALAVVRMARRAPLMPKKNWMD